MPGFVDDISHSFFKNCRLKDSILLGLKNRVKLVLLFHISINHVFDSSFDFVLLFCLSR